MGLNINPLSHAGYPPNVTGTPSTQPSQVRAATLAEAEAGVLNYVYISPATLSASSTADFASPPPLGATTPNTVAATTLTANSETITTSGATTGLVVNTASGTGVGETITTSGATVDALQLTGGGLKVAPTVVAAGASPLVCNNRFGQVTFSGASIAAAATQTFVITNSLVTGATTNILISLTGGTTGASLSVQSYTPSAGSVSIVVQNGTGATTSTGNLTFIFWVLD